MGGLVSRAVVSGAILAACLSVGCAKGGPVPPVADGSAEGGMVSGKDWPGTDAELELYRALSVRDPEPVCAEVEALVPDPVASLTLIAEDIPMPPWAAMRAAGCLVEGHAIEAEETLRSWVVDEERRGLALLTLQYVDEMAELVAVEVVRDALEGPFAEEAEDAAAGSERAAVRALLSPG